VDTFDFEILSGDSFLLCSDGMYVYFNDADLPALLADGEVNEVTHKLIDQANAGGGHDNITNVVVRVHRPQHQRASTRAEELNLKLDVLKNMPMFRYLSYKELMSVLNLTTTCHYKGGASIFCEGDLGEAMYVVLEGSVRLHKESTTVTTIEPGQHFGEMALVDQAPRSLSATSNTCRLLVWKRKEFYRIIKKQPELSVKLLWSFVQVLGVRLRKTTQDLGELQTQSEDSEIKTLPFVL